MTSEEIPYITLVRFSEQTIAVKLVMYFPWDLYGSMWIRAGDTLTLLSTKTPSKPVARYSPSSGQLEYPVLYSLIPGVGYTATGPWPKRWISANGNDTPTGSSA
jgi:hypothetical protein